MATVDEKRSEVLSTAGIIGCFVGLCGASWMVLHGLWMQFQIEPTTENLEAASVGRWLFVLGVGAVAACVVALAWLRNLLRVAVAVAVLMSVPAVEVWATRQTSAPRAVTDELKAFEPPPSFGDGTVSDNGRSGSVERSWLIRPPIDAESACEGLEQSLQRWADEGSVVADPTIRPCYFTATRKGGDVTADVHEGEYKADRWTGANVTYSPLRS